MERLFQQGVEMANFTQTKGCRKKADTWKLSTVKDKTFLTSKEDTDQLDRKLTIPKLENSAFRWRALFSSFLSVVSIKNTLAQSAYKAPASQNLTAKTEQKHTVSILDTVKLPEVTVISLYPTRRAMVEGLMSIEMPQVKQQEPKKTLDEKIPDAIRPRQQIKEWFRHFFRKKPK